MPSIISQTLPDLTGQFIDDGALELLCLLGSGAYGKVYKARDTSAPLDEPAIYAVKCMPRYEPGSRGEHFQQEELSVHQMVSDHPRIITFHRYFVTDDYLFLVLEYASGGDFFRAMVERQLFRGQTQLIKQAMNQILDAVDCLHRNSIYHRDIKPENLLCDEDGSDIRLTDFGLSTQTSLSREFGCGTRFYMCPESLDPSINGGLYCARFSDLWAVSVIFVNLISGRHPWSSADLTDAGFAAFRSDNDYLQRALGITPESSALLKRCFDENPLRRPNIAQLREAVNEIEVFAVVDNLQTLAPLPLPHAIPPPPPQFCGSVSLEWAVAMPSSGLPDLQATPQANQHPARMPQAITFIISSSSGVDLPESDTDSSALDSSPPSTPAASTSIVYPRYARKGGIHPFTEAPSSASQNHVDSYASRRIAPPARRKAKFAPIQVQVQVQVEVQRLSCSSSNSVLSLFPVPPAHIPQLPGLLPPTADHDEDEEDLGSLLSLFPPSPTHIPVAQKRPTAAALRKSWAAQHESLNDRHAQVLLASWS